MVASGTEDRPDAGETRRAALAFIRRYGAEAPAEALQRANELKAAGNEEGFRTWQAIYAEIVLHLGKGGTGAH